MGRLRGISALALDKTRTISDEIELRVYGLVRQKELSAPSNHSSRTLASIVRPQDSGAGLTHCACASVPRPQDRNKSLRSASEFGSRRFDPAALGLSADGTVDASVIARTLSISASQRGIRRSDTSLLGSRRGFIAGSGESGSIIGGSRRGLGASPSARGGLDGSRRAFATAATFSRSIIGGPGAEEGSQRPEGSLVGGRISLVAAAMMRDVSKRGGEGSVRGLSTAVSTPLDSHSLQPLAEDPVSDPRRRVTAEGSPSPPKWASSLTRLQQASGDSSMRPAPPRGAVSGAGRQQTIIARTALQAKEPPAADGSQRGGPPQNQSAGAAPPPSSPANSATGGLVATRLAPAPPSVSRSMSSIAENRRAPSWRATGGGRAPAILTSLDGSRRGSPGDSSARGSFSAHGAKGLPSPVLVAVGEEGDGGPPEAAPLPHRTAPAGAAPIRLSHVALTVSEDEEVNWLHLTAPRSPGRTRAWGTAKAKVQAVIALAAPDGAQKSPSRRGASLGARSDVLPREAPALGRAPSAFQRRSLDSNNASLSHLAFARRSSIDAPSMRGGEDGVPMSPSARSSRGGLVGSPSMRDAPREELGQFSRSLSRTLTAATPQRSLGVRPSCPFLVSGGG